MSDRDALLAAIRAHPDDDTPRLIFADFLDDAGETARAAFVRAQVEVARSEPWDPVAVRARWQGADALSGRAFAAELPPVKHPVAWDQLPFRRGFGYALRVTRAADWPEFAEWVFDREPVGALSFWSGTLDEWKRVAASPHVKRFRELTFHNNPIEPLFALRDAPGITGVTDVRFERATGAGLPEVVEDLMRSALGGALCGLHFRVGYGSTAALVRALNTGGPLERLSFRLMGLGADHLTALFDGPVASALSALHLLDEPLGLFGLAALTAHAPPALRDLDLSALGVSAEGAELIARCERLARLKRLNLSGNRVTPRAARVLSLSHALAGLRALDLSDCRMGDKELRHLTRAKFWSNLVELNLRGNSFSPAGVRALIDAPVPADLTALVLEGPALGGAARAALVQHFGAAVVFVAPLAPF
jgi:uncharacterized protein (TIGR02996 family)